MQSNKLMSEESRRKNTIEKFARVKTIIKLKLMNIGSHPGKKPTDTKLLAAWQEKSSVIVACLPLKLQSTGTVITRIVFLGRRDPNCITSHNEIGPLRLLSLTVF
jgi:hypothetical protein